MKILVVTHSYGLNGAGLLLREVVKHWAYEKKWLIDVLMSPEEFKLHSVTLTKLGARPIVSLDLIKDKYDVALVNTLLDIQFVPKLSQFVPVVLWAHEGKTLLFNWQLPVSSLVNYFSESSRIIFQTAWQSEQVFKSFIDHLPKNRISLVPSGVETDHNAFKSKHDIGSIIKVVTVGTVYPRKRQMDLIEAIDKLSEKYPIECIIIGEYNQAQSWEKRIKSDLSNKCSHIKWLGGIDDRSKINEILINADIACFPSGDESHPLALLEAGICALPMVISELPPYKFIGWTNEKNCLTHKVGDVAHLKNQIERLINDANLRARLANNSRRMVLNKYSKKLFLDNMDKIFSSFSQHHAKQ
jgi:glycosyltransferase involved in cell wall biosynthesis